MLMKMVLIAKENCEIGGTFSSSAMSIVGRKAKLHAFKGVRDYSAIGANN
jgi:hypothetical protein